LQYQAFRNGITLVFDAEFFDFFHPEEIDLLLNGIEKSIFMNYKGIKVMKI
jgi:hypothetical protein